MKEEFTGQTLIYFKEYELNGVNYIRKNKANLLNTYL